VTASTDDTTLGNPPRSAGEHRAPAQAPTSPSLTALSGPRIRRLRADVGARPFIVLFELTRACDLACRHCRAEACPTSDPEELTTEEAESVLDDLARLGAPRPIVVLTGGDPFKRPDLARLVRHGTRLGLPIAASPSGTPLATPHNLTALRTAGARTVSFSLDGSSETSHDVFRGVDGSFGWTLRGCRSARDAGLRLQINTTVTADTVEELPGILQLVRDLGANLWSIFFLVTTGRGRELQPLSASDTEDVLYFLYEAASVVPLKTTEAPQYRRVVVERGSTSAAAPVNRGPLYRALACALSGSSLPPRGTDGGGQPPGTERTPLRSPMAVGDGRGVVFVSHIGDVSPSGFLPLVVGNVRDANLVEIYRSSPLFQDLRDPDRLHGRCGRCEYRSLCGGSRARAYAATGDPLGEDPACPYIPA